MTKTSQQIAEEMAAKCASKFLDSNLLIRESVMDQIPLTQLIEVARAANRIRRDDSKNALFTVDDAIIALKQTGKAEWL